MHLQTKLLRMALNGLCKDSIVRVYAENENNKAPADFEKAISATGFGKYNIVLLLATIPAGWASAFATTAGAFYISSAHCDLHLSVIRNSLLLCVVYIEMIVSSFFWGFVTDTTSRKPLFILGLFVDACCNILSSVIDSYSIFLLIKFITGTIVSGPYAFLIPYLADFQPSVHRAKFVSWTKLIFAIGNVMPAALAYFILPLPWSFTVFNRVFVSWRCFRLFCSIPSILGLVTVSFLPENPKRLIAIGESDRALKLMKRIYSINTGKSTDTFPVKLLIDETKLVDEKRLTTFEKIRERWNNLLALLKPPHRSHYLIIFFLQFGSMLGFNTMRLWVPHIFTVINNFDYTLWDSSKGNPSLCQLLVRNNIPTSKLEVYVDIADKCVQWCIESFIYENVMIIASSIVVFTFIIVMYLDTKHKKKVILATSLLVGTISCFGANWGQIVPGMLILCSLVATTSSIASNIVATLDDHVIPPTLKSTATCSITIVGSLGTVIGNLVFANILDTECIAAFMFLGSCLLLCFVVSLFTLRSPPEPEKLRVAEEPEMMITRL